MKKLTFEGLSILLALFSFSLFADTISLVENTAYVRGKGEPITEHLAFSGSDTNGTFTLQIYNGGLDHSLTRVAAANIWVNGELIVTEFEFNQQVTYLERPVALNEQNQLAVELKGKPEGTLIINLSGNIDNRLPIITSAPPGSANEDALFTYQVEATDPDSLNTLTYALTQAPGGMLIDAATGLISWTPVQSDVGSHDVIVTVTDLEQGQSTQSFTLLVENVNDAPLITSTAVIAATEDSPYSYQVTATDEDPGDTLTYSLGISPNGMSIDGQTGLFSWTPDNDNVGDNNVTVIVTDAASASAVQSFVISVANVNDAPVFTSTAITNTNEDEEYRYSLLAEDVDVDVGDSLSFSLVTAPEGMVLEEATNSLVWTPVQENVGEHAISVTVTDLAGESDTQDFTLTVVNINDAPVIEAIESQTVAATETLSVNIIATDEDDDALTYSLAAPLEGMQIDAATGEFTWTPTDKQQGDTIAQVLVSDGTLEATVDIAITVEPPPNTAPEFTNTADIVGLVGQPLNYAIDVSADTDFTLELISGPEGLQLDTQTNSLIWDSVQEGEFQVVLKASITESVFTEQTFKVIGIDAEPSHEGSDFWFSYGYNFDASLQDINLFLYISSHDGATGSVSVPRQNISIPFSVEAGQVQRIDLPGELLTNTRINQLQDNGIHVVSDNKIVLYALNSRPFTTDGFLVLPTATLGMEYRAISYDGGQVIMTATEDGTEVNVELSEDVYLLNEQKQYYTGDVLSRTLDAGQTFGFDANAVSGGDLTGSKISSNKPIAFFSGHFCTFIPETVPACDHLYEQLPPTYFFSNEYYAMPFAKRFNGDLVRIVGLFDNSKIYINGGEYVTLDEGQHMEASITDASSITSNHPIMVAQYSKGSYIDRPQNQDLGDPFMVLLTPLKQGLSRYQFTTTDQNIEFNFANVIIPEGGLNSFEIDEEPVDISLLERIGDTEYFGAQIELTEGAHNLSSELPFNLSVYGFGGFDSYGYSGGFKLPRLSSSGSLDVFFENAVATVGKEACIGVSYKENGIPIPDLRVDIYLNNTAENIAHGYTDINGELNYCYYGVTVGSESVTVKAGYQSSTVNVFWKAYDGELNHAPQIVSIPNSAAKIGEVYQYPVAFVDANSTDQIELQLLDMPSGMYIDENTIKWQPVLADLGFHNVTVSVTDSQGLSTQQQFKVKVFVGNRSPVLGTPLHDDTIYAGKSYLQRMEDIIDADGDIVYCELLDNSLVGPKKPIPQGCFALLALPTDESDIGTHALTVRLWDRAGGETIYPLTFDVVKYFAPQFTQLPSGYAKVGTEYQSTVEAISPVGLPIEYSIQSIILEETGNSVNLNNLSIDAATGVISFTPTEEVVGKYILKIRAADGIENPVLQLPLVVSSATENLNVSVSYDNEFIGIGNPITISTIVGGATGDVVITATINGEAIEVNSDGTFSFSGTVIAGVYVVQITVTDGAGNSITFSDTFYVNDGSDQTAPSAIIHTVADNQVITGLQNIAITAEDDNFAEWRLYFASVSDESSAVPVMAQNNSVTNQTVYQLDPSLIANGLYRLQLDVFDTSGNVSSDAVVVQLEGNLKVGNFTYTVDEFTVPLAGLPITISRTYDSRRRLEKSDFGYGWFLDYNLIKTEKSRPLGRAWSLNEYTSGPLGTLRDYCVQSDGDILVNITLPNDKVERFHVKASPECNEAAPILDVNLSFEPVGDTQSTLVLKENTLVRLVNGDLTQLGGSELFDAENFILTTRRGYKYDFNTSGDVELITDPNGYTLTFSDEGITHSSGKAIRFTRDSNDKITWIRRPDNGSYTYAYDTQNNLKRASQPGNQFEYYQYDYQHGLTHIFDDQNRTKVLNIYDDNGRLIAQEDTDGNRTEFNHNLAGRQSVITDRNGNITFYYYDDRGNVTSMVDALNHITTYTYDARDNQLTETDPLGNVTTRTYNDKNDLLSVTDPEGNKTSYTYNQRGQELTITDAKGNVYSNTYDGVGNLLTVTDPSGNVVGNNINAQGLVSLTQDMLGNQTTYTYDEQGNKLTQTDAMGNVTTYTYNANNQVLTESRLRTLADGSMVNETITYSYDAQNRLTSTRDAVGIIETLSYDDNGNLYTRRDGINTQVYSYDVYGRLTNTRYPDGSETSSTYDAEGNKLSDTDRNGHTTAYEYDALNRLVKTIYPDDSFTSVEYDAAGRMTSETNENGHTTIYAYDKAGRRTQITDALGHTTEFEYDAEGNLVKQTDTLGHITQYEYDALNRRTAIVFNDTTRSEEEYDALGRNTVKQDQNSLRTQYTYDVLSRLTQVTDALGNITQYQYDEVGNKVAQVDAEGRITRWEYDARGRVIARVLPEGQRESFSYRADDKVSSYIDFNGQSFSYTYSGAESWLVQKTFGFAESFSYDLNGNRTLAQTYDAKRYLSEYDSRNHLIKETQPNGAVLEYSYDGVGNKTGQTITYQNGDVRTQSYSYDALNRLTSITDHQGQITTYACDAVGNQTHIHYPNGLVAIYSYDDLNRVTAVETQDDAGNVLSRYAYQLDNTGRRTQISEDSGRISSYSYDDGYRLATENITDPTNGSHNSSYVYDKVGNRTQRTVNGIITDYVYDQNDRLTSSTEGSIETSYSYDANGNLLTKNQGASTKTYSYDRENQLTDFTDGSISASYRYNTEGIRRSKTLNGELTDFIVDSNLPYEQVIAEQASDHTILKEYVFGSDLLSQNQAGTSHFYHYNSLGTVTELSDSAGTLTDSYQYEAFGELLGQTGTTDNQYLYTGEQFDAELDNYYLRARYYNPDVGRFTQMDTYQGRMSEPLTLHKYMYTHADPINNIDPSGNVTLSGVMAGIRARAMLGPLAQNAGRSALNRFLIGNTTRTTATGTVSSGNSVGFIGQMVVNEAREALIDTLMDYALGGLDPFSPKSTFGTKAHSRFESRIKELNKRLNKNHRLLKRFGITVRAEPFFDTKSGGFKPGCRRCKGSFGIDVSIMRGGEVLRSFDLKTGGGWSKKESKKRARSIGASVFQIFMVPKK